LIFSVKGVFVAKAVEANVGIGLATAVEIVSLGFKSLMSPNDCDETL
jgi:hypothetical protein